MVTLMLKILPEKNDNNLTTLVSKLNLKLARLSIEGSLNYNIGPSGPMNKDIKRKTQRVR